MAGLLSYVVRGRAQAAATSAAFAVVSLRVPPVLYLSGAVIGVMTLRYGALEGGLMVAGSSLLAAVFAALVVQTAMPVLAFAVAMWVPVWLLAMVLRLTQAQGLMLAASGVMGIAAALGLRLALGDPTAWWRGVLHATFVAGAKQAGVNLHGAALQRLSHVLDALAPLMTGMVAAGTVLGLVLTVLLARWWHATLDNRGGFGREFRALRLPPALAVVTIVLLVAAVALAGAWSGMVARDLLFTLLVLWLFQGMAVVHALVRGRKGGTGWLVAVYGLLVLLPLQAVMLVSLVGFVDTWMRFRERVAPR